MVRYKLKPSLDLKSRARCSLEGLQMLKVSDDYGCGAEGPMDRWITGALRFALPSGVVGRLNAQAIGFLTWSGTLALRTEAGKKANISILLACPPKVLLVAAAQKR
jgi:hypothetical protein